MSLRNGRFRDIQDAFRRSDSERNDIAWLIQEVKTLETLIPSPEAFVQAIDHMDFDAAPEAAAWLEQVQRILNAPGRS